MVIKKRNQSELAQKNHASVDVTYMCTNLVGVTSLVSEITRPHPSYGGCGQAID